jgi:hypothetical protein
MRSTPFIQSNPFSVRIKIRVQIVIVLVRLEVNLGDSELEDGVESMYTTAIVKKIIPIGPSLPSLGSIEERCCRFSDVRMRS